MHLKQLKLAGFKSFVDPTVVDFPGQLVAVLGPNGCGKSNIIDAVRWVMGESSAKNLRGESMVDVIFNGSSNRKPLGQASVELIFDNSLGKLVGPFASYGEISVKRVVTRAGDSSYYLNGSRCRRKDITDIFLGTGAGARGYSIIGQGTISQLIEAKPEDLRGFLEEAAGVSKYKERRRETLLRIEHTRDNLTRVADIRDELDKVLQRLERQAHAATKYKQLKSEEHIRRSQKEALKWQGFSLEQSTKQRLLQEAAIAYEAQQSVLTGIAKQRAEMSISIHEANDQHQQLQTVFYQLATNIARLEENLQQHERDKKRLEQDKQKVQEECQIASQQLQMDKDEYALCQELVQDLLLQTEQLTADVKTKEQQYLDSKNQQSTWEVQWQALHEESNKNKRELEVLRLDIQHIQQSREQATLRFEKLKTEQSTLSLADLQTTKQVLAEKHLKLQEAQEFDEAQLKQAQDKSNQLRSQLKDTEEQLHQVQDEFHRINTEYATLQAMQNAARTRGIGSAKTAINDWQDRSKLMDVLEVEPKWRNVVEMVLNNTLQAYVLDDFTDWWSHSHEMAGEMIVTMLAPSSFGPNTKEELRNSIPSSALRAPSPHVLGEGENEGNLLKRAPSLASQITGNIPAAMPSLAHIYCVDTLDEAKNLYLELLDHESIVTIDGFWIGLGWAKQFATHQEDEVGILERQQKINQLSTTVQTLEQKIETHRTLRDEYHQELQQAQHYVELFQLNLNGSNEAVRSNSSAISNNEQAILHAERFLITIEAECEELTLRLEETVLALDNKSMQLQALEEQQQQLLLKQEQFNTEKQAWNELLTRLQKEFEDARSVLHLNERALDKEKTKTHHLVEKLAREEERSQSLQERLENLILQCEASHEPDVNLSAELANQLEKHNELEKQISAGREHLESLQQALANLEKLSLQHDQELKAVQDQISQLRMEEQALSVRASAIQEALTEQGVNVNEVLEQIPQGLSQSQCEEELLAISDKIKRLGAINLAAIEEYDSEKQRKIYLDEQYNDLTQALSTLETAIAKMDDETRYRLETTFAEVNTSFKALFPRLFGGGRAQLELTCENLLEAGIVVMAQPPGKRNSTIHLLSGGEKAMTAVALVFAIFQLNPSPFCMLDEVDAPLDDVNVGRFCDLVKEMSQFVQFLFITHNKVTMELADHLIGVTMREPGVSRLVAVDVKQALTME